MKSSGEQLFETFDAQDLNIRLRNLMDGLSVKVFRTYNASIVLDRLLDEDLSSLDTVDARKAAYDRANKEVAILCNHQRAIPKAHEGQMEKLASKMKELHAELKVCLAWCCALIRSFLLAVAVQGVSLPTHMNQCSSNMTILQELEANFRLAKKGEPTKEGRKANPDV